MRILTWHTHGRYLQSLSHLAHEIFLPVSREGAHPYGGRGEGHLLPRNVYDVPMDFVRDLDVDVVIFQSRDQWKVEQCAAHIRLLEIPIALWGGTAEATE